MMPKRAISTIELKNVNIYIMFDGDQGAICTIEKEETETDPQCFRSRKVAVNLSLLLL